MKDTIQKQLLSMADPVYKEFHSKLIPTLDPADMIGIRVPVLRRFVKTCMHSDEVSAFLMRLPHRYYEENNLHAFMIEQIQDYQICLDAIERFLPYIDN